MQLKEEKKLRCFSGCPTQTKTTTPRLRKIQDNATEYEVLSSPFLVRTQTKFQSKNFAAAVEH